MNHLSIVVITLFISSFSIAQSVSDAVAYFPFDGNVQDVSPSSISATNNGCVYSSDRDGDINEALSNDGNSNFVSFNNNAVKVDLPITISVWVNISNHSSNMIFRSDNEYNNYYGYWILCNPSGNISMSISGGLGTANSSNRRTYRTFESLSENTWHHVVGIIRDWNDMDVYIDCIKATGEYTGSGSTTMVYSNFDSRIGSDIGNSLSPNGTFIDGSIDELAIWDRELTETEINNLCRPESHLAVSEERHIEFNIYPNPATNLLNISAKGGSFDKVELYGVDGKLVLKRTGQNLSFIDLEGIDKGTYFIKIFNENNLLKTKKVVKH